MRSKALLHSAINKWNAIVQTNPGHTDRDVVRIIEESGTDGKMFSVKVTVKNGYMLHCSEYRGEQSLDAMKEHVYNLLVEDLIFILFGFERQTT